MELKLGNNCSFTMTLLGYQFPELEHVEYDSNWLNVKIDVSQERGSWSATDPALLTYEVAWLIDWLRAVSAGRYDEREQEFLEPCVSFHLSPTEGEPHNLVIEFSHGFEPPWATNDRDEQHQIVFPLTSVDLIGAAQSLEDQLRQYPQRTVR